MKYIILTLLALLISGLLSVGMVHADISRFVIVTDPQTIPANTNSATITLQSQNSAGDSENLSETIDLVFTSSSATGVFLSTSGNPVTLTMSKNTANKNFLYVDPASGTFTITVKATGRTSLQTFSATQQIVVGTTSSSSTPPVSPPSPAPTPISPSASAIVASDTSSAHSSPAPLSNTVENPSFEVSAGRDRLTSIGNNLIFKASVLKSQNIPESGISYVWSFGDGSIGVGIVVHHSYRFAGTYPIVLNATFSDKQAVSRLIVKVISPEVSISRVQGGIEIWNRSNIEINLEGWKLVSGTKSFVFPNDSLIPAGYKIDFADETTDMNSPSVSLQNPLGKMFASAVETESPKAKEDATSTLMSLAELQEKIKDLKSKLSQLSPSPLAAAIPIRINSAASSTPQTTVTLDKNTETAAVIDVFTASSNPSFIGRIFSWPARGYGFVRHLFVED